MIPPEPETDSPLQRDFVELATRPLEDLPEIRDEARGELMGRLSARSPEERKAALEAALPHLAKAIPGSWKAIAFAVAWLLLAAAVGWQVHGICREFVTVWTIEQDRLRHYLGGMGSSSSQRWESSATSPASLEAEIQERIYRRHVSPPSNIAELREKLDPGNGAWALLEAELKHHKSRAVFHAQAEWIVPEECWMLVEEAANSPRFQIYAPATRAARMQEVPHPRTMLELSTRQHPYEDLRAIDPPSFFEERAHQLESAGDEEGTRAMIRVWERLCMRFADTSLQLSDFWAVMRMVARDGAALASPYPAGRRGTFRDRELVLSQQSAIEDAYSLAPPNPSCPVTVRNHIILGAEPDAAACAPGREMEYAFAERVMAAGAAIPLLLALAGVGFESIRRGRRVNGLAKGLAPLFTGRDGLWVLGLGVLAPILYYWGVTRLTPFGCRDMAAFSTDYPWSPIPGSPGLPRQLMPLPRDSLWLPISAAAALLLLLSLSIQTAQWRISRRTGFLATAPKSLWPGWLVVWIAAILVALPGTMRWLPESDREDFFIFSGASCGIPLLWLMWRAGAVIFSPGTNALGGVLLARALALPLLLAATFLAGAYVFLQQREKHIIATDPVVGWDAAHGTTRQETRSVEHLKRRFHEVFGEAGKPPEQ